MTTFSQLVDALVAETRRPDMLSEIVSYTNQTIREVHFEPERNRALMFPDNFEEALLVASKDTGYSWTIPDPATFQAMQVVKYVTVDKYPPERIPSRALQDLDEYYYRANGQYVFSGYGGEGAQIGLGFYEFPRRLMYYVAARRPAEYSPDVGWSYASPFQPTEQVRLAAQGFVSNWLIFRWPDVIAEGVRAKVYKRVSDTERARTCYSSYQALRQNLVSSESAMPGGFT